MRLILTAGVSLPRPALALDDGERTIDPFFDDPFPDFDTEPVMAYAKDPDFTA